MVDSIQLRSAEERGLQQGVQQGVLETILRQLSRRFGDVTGSTLQQLHKMNTQQLNDLSLDLFDFVSYADLESWLVSH